MFAIWWLAIAALTSQGRAQKFCDPTRQDCDPVPAIGRTISCDFTQGKCDLFVEAEGTVLKYDKDGAQFIIASDRDAPTLSTLSYMFFGRLEAELQVMPGKGLVTSLVLQSDALDEIDIEWVGGSEDEMQTNFFNKGNTTIYDRDGVHQISNVTGSFHNYTVQWTSRSISWHVDGKEIRVEGRRPYDEGFSYPQTPAQIKFGCWVAGRSDAAKETVKWAGGMADLSHGPAIAFFRRVTITDFAGGDEMPLKRTKDYEYTNRNGTYQSIKVVETDEDNEAVTAPATTAMETETQGSDPAQTAIPGGKQSDGADDEGTSGGLTSGAIAGIAIGSIAFVAIILAVFFLLRRRKKQEPTEDPTSPASERIRDPSEGWKKSDELPAEMNGIREPQEVHAVSSPQEMNGIGLPQEMDSKTEPVELDSTPVWRDKPLI